MNDLENLVAGKMDFTRGTSSCSRHSEGGTVDQVFYALGAKHVTTNTFLGYFTLSDFG